MTDFDKQFAYDWYTKEQQRKEQQRIQNEQIQFSQAVRDYLNGPTGDKKLKAEMKRLISGYNLSIESMWDIFLDRQRGFNFYNAKELEKFLRRVLETYQKKEQATEQEEPFVQTFVYGDNSFPPGRSY